jgi:hypothetical protein
MERINRISLFFLVLSASLLCVEAKTISPAENGAIRRFVGLYDSITNIEGKPPTSWAVIAKYDEGLEGFEDYFPEGQNIDTIYSFVAEEDRAKYPEGELLLIRAEPRDWPEVWKHTPPEIDPSELTEDQKAEFERLKNREQPIRYLVYRKEGGDLESVWWFEEDVQKMLAETGIRVPEPEPYQAQVVSESPATTTESEAVEAAEKATAPEQATEELASAEPSAEPTEQSSNWWLWLIGAVLVVGGIGLTLRRKS